YRRQAQIYFTDGTNALSHSLDSIISVALLTGMDDNELKEIREKRMAELKEKMEHQGTTGSMFQFVSCTSAIFSRSIRLLSSISGPSGAGRAGGSALRSRNLHRSLPGRLRLRNATPTRTSSSLCSSIFQRSQTSSSSRTGRWWTG